MPTCPCGFDAPDLFPWSPEWHRRHRDHHLATYPNVDQRTRDNLETLISLAEQRAIRTAEAR
jgi:hypothetical protein